MAASMRRSSTLLIVNPHARSAGDTDLDDGLRRLEQAGQEIIRVQPDSRAQTVRAIADHRAHVDRIVVAGGDGTVSSAAEGLVQSGLPLGLLPLGTANDLARTLGIPTDVSSACEVIVQGCRRKIDLGRVNDHYFFNVANIGLGVRITHELTPKAKKYFGIFSYLKAFSTAISKERDFVVSLTIDTRRYRLRSIQLAIGNGRYYGGGNLIDADATIDDGLLALYSIRPQSLWELITLAPVLREGRQYQSERVFNALGQRIELQTSRSMEIHADGEPVTHTPAVFDVIEQALEVYVPCATNEAP